MRAPAPARREGPQRPSPTGSSRAPAPAAADRLAGAAAAARRQGLQLPGLGQRTFTTYESNIAFVMRYMVDAGIVGANWVALPAGKYLLRSGPSNVQLEADVMWEHFVSHAPDGEWLRVGPLRILSFDIECAGRKGFFPEAEKDPVIQIANWVSVQVRGYI